MAAEYKKLELFKYLTGTGRSVKRWEKKGLIAPEQAEAIIGYEKERQGRRLMRGLFGLGILAIALGVLSVIGANWANIPGEIKIAAHFVLNAIVAVTLYRADKRDDKYWREGACALLLGLNLTLIVLIGQVFQLSGSTAGALGLWMAISTPAVFLYGRSLINAIPWTSGFIATLYAVLFETLDHAPEQTVFLSFLGVGLYLPLALLAAGLNRKVHETRPHWTAVFVWTGMTWLAVGGTLASFGWYGWTAHAVAETIDTVGGYSAMLGLFIGVPAVILLYRKTHKSQDSIGAGIVLASVASIALPLVLMPEGPDFMAAIHFIAYWAFLGWSAHRMGHEHYVSHAITLITLRVIAVYIELFGGLLLTGLGLIGGGALLLGTLHVARKAKEWIRETAVEGDDHVL